MMPTYRTLLDQTAERFKRGGLEDPVFQARQLLYSCFNLDATRYFIEKENAVKENTDVFMTKAARLLAGEPLQYILGEWAFMGLPFAVGRGVLIPRPETEMLCELALASLADVEKPVIYDLCAGSGCIGITMAVRRPDAKVYLFEKSPDAIAYCKKNMQLYAVDNAELVLWDIFEKYVPMCMADAILSNPPYIETAVLPNLQQQVQYEPVMALDGGEDGLRFYRAILKNWMPLLKQNGFLAVEHGEGQSGGVMDLLAPAFYCLQMHRDLAGLDRIITGKRKESLDYTVKLM